MSVNPADSEPGFGGHIKAFGHEISGILTRLANVPQDPAGEDLGQLFAALARGAARQ
jgi:hypothetical protein